MPKTITVLVLKTSGGSCDNISSCRSFSIYDYPSVFCSLKDHISSLKYANLFQCIFFYLRYHLFLIFNFCHAVNIIFIPFIPFYFGGALNDNTYHICVLYYRAVTYLTYPHHIWGYYFNLSFRYCLQSTLLH